MAGLDGGGRSRRARRARLVRIHADRSRPGKRCARRDLRDSAGNVGAPDVGGQGRHPAGRDPPDDRHSGHSRSQEPGRRAADLRSDPHDARPEFPLAVRAGVRVSVRVHGARERADDGHRGAVSGDALGESELACARTDPRGWMKRVKEILPSLLVIAALVAAWWTAVIGTQSVIFPTPWDVIAGAFELVEDGTLSQHIAASLMRGGTGFLLAVCVAVPLGLWMGWVRGAYSTLNPIFQILRPISPIAWIPIAILWFGVGNASPIYLIFISSVFPMVVQTTVGVHTIEKRYLRAAENLGVSRRTLFTQVVIPAALPQVVVGMRIGLGVAWLVVVAAEMIALRSGLGYMIMDSRNAGNRYDLVVAGMVIIGLIGLSLDSG